MAGTNAGGERRLALLHCELRTGKGRGTEKRKGNGEAKMDLAIDAAAGALKR